MNEPIDPAPEPGPELTLPLDGEAPADGLAGTGLVGAVQVGRGGFGTVYKATEPALGRLVALKMLNAGLDASQRDRFAREGRALGALSAHPNIVTVFRVGETADAVPYLVMAYLPGGTLAERIRAAGPLTGVDAAALGQQLAAALGTAHAAGILHRDIKPENVLFDEYGTAQLADFGIAHMASEATSATVGVYASMQHAAPEVLEGGAATEASDVYSLGSTLFQALRGGVAFPRRDGELLAAYFVRIGREALPDLRQVGVDDTTVAAVEAAMAKDPAQRPSATRFGEMLAGGGSASPGPAVLAAPGAGRAKAGAGRAKRSARAKAAAALAAVVAAATALTLTLLPTGGGSSAGPARLVDPTGVVLEPDGSLVIVDTGRHQLIRVRRDGDISIVAGTGKANDAGELGPAVDAGLSHPSGLTRGPDGSLATGAAGRIRVIAADGILRTVRTQDDAYLAADSMALDTRGTAAPDGWLVGINGAVLRVSERGEVETVAGNAARPGFSGDGGPARSAQLGRIAGLAVGDDDAVFVSDSSNRIRRIDPDGTIDTFAGGGSRAGRVDSAKELKLSGPAGLFVTADALLVADAGDHRVLRIALDGSDVQTIAGDPNGYREGFSGDGGPALAAHFGTVHAVVADTEGTVYVVDRSNRRVRRIDSAGVVQTVA